MSRSFSLHQIPLPQLLPVPQVIQPGCTKNDYGTEDHDTPNQAGGSSSVRPPLLRTKNARHADVIAPACPTAM